jgi:uncharacterized RDD family membrane protein YckC
MSNQGPQQPGWGPQSGQPQGPGYPAAPPHPGYAQPQPGYAPQQPGYPPQQPGYPQPGYPQQQPGYPPQQPGYAAPPGYAQPPGYAPPGYPQAGYAPAPAGGVAFGGFWIRVGAYLIDGIVIGIPLSIVIGIVFAAVLSGPLSSGNEREIERAAAGSAGAFIIVYLLAFVAIWLYEAMMLSSAAGGTVGKRALGLRVVRGTDGSRLSFGRATGRFFAKAFLTGLIPFGIGYMMAGFTDRKRALHDMIADTVVIKRQ